MMRIKKRWLVPVALLFFLLFFQLPYYYSQPGSAITLHELITMEDSFDQEGRFMLTTVKMGRATIPFYLWAKVSPYYRLHSIEQLKYEGESDEQYHERQLMIMKQSQDAAKIVAYRHANKEVMIENKGVYVTSLINGMPAKEVLQSGDMIVQVDGEKVKTAEQLLQQLRGYSVDDEVTLTIERDENTFDVRVGFAPFPKELQASDEEAVGIGIAYPITARELTFDPDVQMDTSEIGGPSAGLMFALQIYNMLTPEDMTKGYAIAGTGTLNEEGKVGRIGGAGQKVVAAHKAGADFFLAPNEGGSPESNYVEAKRTAEQIGTEMQIVPVDTFEDALQFLQSLHEKMN